MRGGTLDARSRHSGTTSQTFTVARSTGRNEACPAPAGRADEGDALGVPVPNAFTLSAFSPSGLLAVRRGTDGREQSTTRAFRGLMTEHVPGTCARAQPV